MRETSDNFFKKKQKHTVKAHSPAMACFHENQDNGPIEG